MKKCFLLTWLFVLAALVPAYAGEIPVHEVKLPEMKAVAPAVIENETVCVKYEGGEKGQGGAKITFTSKEDGYKKIIISYDHAHMTGHDVKMRYYMNLPDDALEGGVNFEATNIANGRWGRFTDTHIAVPVKKGVNTFRLASNQNSAGWNFYVDKICYSEATFATEAEVPQRFIDVPRPQNLLDRFESEILDNNRMVRIIDTEASEGGYKYITVGQGRTAQYDNIDFGNENITSLTIRHKSDNCIPYVQILLDAETILAEGNLPCDDMDFTWTQTTFYFPPVNGKHSLSIHVVYGNAMLNWMQFGKETEIQEEIVPIRDTKSDTWVAVDDLGRVAPTLYDVGYSRQNRFVGMFYFVWHQTKNTALYDHNAAYNAGGVEAVWDVMAQGGLGYQHYWSRPYFGYYRAGDEWVIRKHATMLKNAGVDFIFFDNSNDICYPGTLQVIFNVWSQMRKEGIDTPQVSFLFGDHDDRSNRQSTNVYYYFMKSGKYDDLWFRWEGKPLVLAVGEAVENEEVRNSMTFRKSWAFNGWTGGGKGRWPWLAESPQRPGKDEEGNIEQVSVACGFHANTSTGRSYHDGKQPTDGLGAFEFELETTPLGLAYAEQWETAYEVQPPLVMITGWNEWWAGRWEGSGSHTANTYISDINDERKKHQYVDNFNPEFSRDLEPEDGKLGDNYYQQTVQAIRKYKGVRDIPTAYGAKDIQITADFSAWKTVNPTYYDTLGDIAHRNEPATSGDEVYVNETGRNDIDIAKVSLFGDSVSFYVAAKDSFIGTDTQNFMNLFINSDGDYTTGWYGYDYLLNRSRDGKVLSIEKHQDGWNWIKVGDAPYAMGEKELQVKIPLSVLGMQSDIASFDFKWADNSVTTDKIMDFYDLGDTAPDDRFNYRWKKAVPNLSEEISGKLSEQSALVMKVGSSVSYMGTMAKDSKDFVPVRVDGKILVPIRPALEYFGARLEVSPKRRVVFVVYKDQNFSISFDALKVQKDARTVIYDGPMQMINDRIYIDAEGVAALMGGQIAIDGDVVFIGNKIDKENVVSPY